MFTDTHCHIFKEYYDDIFSVLKISMQNNTNRWINNGCDKYSNEEVINLINSCDNMYGALGIHPENVLDYKNADLEFIEHNLNNPRVIAIGEIGLDYHYTKDNKEEQLQLFEKQLQIAEKNHLPVIIHSRDATLDTLNTLKKYHVHGVIHSFSGSYEIAKEYIQMGFLLGINGVITFKNANLKNVIQEIDLSNIILETDSPYLTPEPFRGQKNNPSHIFEIAKFICTLKKCSLLELSEITNKNIAKLFHI